MIYGLKNGSYAVIYTAAQTVANKAASSVDNDAVRGVRQAQYYASIAGNTLYALRHLDVTKDLKKDIQWSKADKTFLHSRKLEQEILDAYQSTGKWQLSSSKVTRISYEFLELKRQMLRDQFGSLADLSDRKLQEEIQRLLTDSRILKSRILRLEAKGSALTPEERKQLLLIGIESVAPTTYFAVAVSQQNIRQQQKFLEIEMYWLPFVDHQQCVAHMDICLHKKRNVELVDWYVKQPNQGYGSILMKHVLSFLRTIGYDYFWGSIQPRDFDHLELLLHFYRNFGFEITPRKKSYAIKLYLLPDSKSSEQSMAMSNACVGHGIGTGEAEIKLQPMLLNLTVGQKAIVTPEICLEHTPLDLMAFFSQNPKIAAVDNSGTIVAISPGTTDVIYQCGEIGAYCRVTVKDEILPIEHDPKQSDSQDRG